MQKSLQVNWYPDITDRYRHCQLMGDTTEEVLYFIDWDRTFDGMPIGDFPFRTSFIFYFYNDPKWTVLKSFGDLETAKIFCQEHYKSFDITQNL